MFIQLIFKNNIARDRLELAICVCFGMQNVTLFNAVILDLDGEKKINVDRTLD